MRTTRPFALAVISVSLVLFTTTVRTNAEDVPELFTAISSDLDPPENSDTTLLRSRLVLMDETVYDSLRYDNATIGSTISLSLFDDFQPLFSLEHRQAAQYLNGWGSDATPTGAAGYRWRGRLALDEGSAIINAIGETLEMQAHRSTGKIYRVAPYAGLIYLVEEHQATYEGFCGTQVELPDLSGLVLNEDIESSSMFDGGSSCEEECDTGTEVHLLVVYNADAKAAATGSCSQSSEVIHCRIIEAIADANQALQNSEITLELRLVGMLEVTYTDTNLCTDLARLTDPGDGYMDEIHRWRDYLNADVVCFISTSTYCGDALSGLAHITNPNSRDLEQTAFSVVNVNQINPNAGLFLLAHEIGHNLGCAHDHDTENCGDCLDSCPSCPSACSKKGAYPFSFGHKFTADSIDRFTIMAYGDTGEQIVQHFSNPEVMFSGEATGTAGCDYECNHVCVGCTLDCAGADNARTINKTRPTVAKFRRGCDTTGTIASSYNYLTSTLGNAASIKPRMSNNGQRIIFTSAATNFGTDNNSSNDVFIFNRESGSVRIVSANYHFRVNTANGPSGGGCISGGGQWVAFESTATDVIQTHGSTTAKHIYVADTFTLLAKRMSVDSCGALADDDCSASSLSFDGRYVVFVSTATNLVDDVDSGEQHIYLRDRDVNEDGHFDQYLSDCTFTYNLTSLVSRNSSDVEANGANSAPAISGNGAYVAFESVATNLDAATSDTNGYRDIYLRGATSMIRVSKVGSTQGNGDSYSPAISHDGRYIVYASDANNLVSGDSNTKRDIFLHDRVNVTTMRVSIATGSSGTEGNGDSDKPHISPDGRYVIFQSTSTNFDSMTGLGIFVRDVVEEETYRVSLNSSGANANDSCGTPAISDDGRYFAFESVATNLSPNDLTTNSDIFLRDLGRLVFGDLNGDLEVDQQDFDLLLQAWGKCECCAADLDGDDVVDEDDYDLLEGN